MKTVHYSFDEHDVLHALKHYLPAQSPLKNLLKTNIEVTSHGENHNMKANSDVVFSNILGFKKKFLALPKGQSIVVNMSNAKIVDHTCIVTINSMVEDYKEEGGHVKVIGFKNHFNCLTPQYQPIF